MTDQNMENEGNRRTHNGIRVEAGTIRPNGLITRHRADRISLQVSQLKHLIAATLKGHRTITTGRDLPDVSMRLMRGNYS